MFPALLSLPQAAALGAGIGVGIIALAFMFGQALNAQSIRAYAKSEFGELFISAALVAIILGLLANTAGVVQAISPAYVNDANSPDSYYASGTDYFSVMQATQQRLYFSMHTPLQNVVESLTRSSMRLTKLLSYNYNYQVGIPWLNPTGSASPAAGGMNLQSALIMGIDTTSLNLLLADSVQVIYVFLVVVCGAVLLPLGVLLRFIPPARQMASLLLAIALSVFIVFPISVNWSTHLLYNASFGTGIGTISDPGSPGGMLSTVICSPILSGIATIGEDLAGQIVRAISCIGPQALTPFCADPTPVNPADPPIPIGPGLQHFVALYVYLGKFLAGAGNSLALYAMSPTSSEVLDAFNTLADSALPAAVERNLAVLVMVVIQLTCSIVMVKSIAQTLSSENQLYGLSRLV